MKIKKEKQHVVVITIWTGAVFTEAKSGIIDPGLNQRWQFCPDFQFVWTKWSRWRNLLSHWLQRRAGLWFQPIVSDFLRCRKLFMNSTNFQQKILDYFISIISSRSFPHCEYRLWFWGGSDQWPETWRWDCCPTWVGIHKQFLNPAESLGFWNPRISAGFEPYS